MSYPTIHGLEQVIEQQNTLVSLISRENKNVQRLGELERIARQDTDPDNNTSLQLAMESILGNSVLSFESQTGSFLQRVKAAILRIISFIEESIMRLIGWVKKAYTQSKKRRQILNTAYDELNTRLNDTGLLYAVRIKPNQVRWVLEGNLQPHSYPLAVKRIKDLVAQFREAGSTKAIDQLYQIIRDPSEYKDSGASAARGRIGRIVSTQDITPDARYKKVPPNASEYPVASLLGSKTVMFHVFNKSPDERFGYSLVDDFKASSAKVNHLRIAKPEDIRMLINEHKALLVELEQLSELVSNMDRTLRKMRKSAADIKKVVERTDTVSDVDSWIEDHTFFSKFIDAIIRNSTVFPLQLLAHALTVSSTQANIINAMIKTQQ